MECSISHYLLKHGLTEYILFVATFRSVHFVTLVLRIHIAPNRKFENYKNIHPRLGKILIISLTVAFSKRSSRNGGTCGKKKYSVNIFKQLSYHEGMPIDRLKKKNLTETMTQGNLHFTNGITHHNIY